MLIKPSDGKTRLRKYLGADFPGLPSDGATGDDWKNWIKGKLEKSAGSRQTRNLHYTRFDNFRAGRQWLSQRDSRGLREPQDSKNNLRPVLNLLGPALDFRLGILSEQRPGFAYQPVTSGSAGKETAEAQQAYVEYEFYRQRAWLTFLDILYWTQTHGVAFAEVYVDKTRGPEQERVHIIPQDDERYVSLAALGYEQGPEGLIVPLDDSGNFSEPGSEIVTMNEGELFSRVILANEVMVDSEAKSINGPQDAARWFIKRRARDAANVRLETGDDELRGDTTVDYDPNSESIDEQGSKWQRGLPPFPSAKQKHMREIVWEYCVYMAKDANALPEGAWLRIVGNKVIEEAEALPGGVIPFARFTDGSSDPQFFKRPVISDWAPDQTSVNALLAQALQSARLGGGRVLARKNTLLEESFSKILGSVVEWSGDKPEFTQALRQSPDLMPMLIFMIREFEKKSMWNDMARGQVTGSDNSGSNSMQDVSGRALLGTKELFERSFGPMIRAAAEGVTEWANITLQLGKFTLTTPRMIPRVGRPDLAITLDGDKLGDENLVYCDPETMMPLPRALREQILLERLTQGIITQQEYQSRSPYADIRNLSMGESPQWERAKWVNTLLEERHDELSQISDPVELYAPEGGMTILWQDTPVIHKRALMELILNERKPWTLRKMAQDRWGIYDQLERAQADPSNMLPIPWEVIGVPPDKMMMQQQAPMTESQPPMAAAPMPTEPTPAAIPTSPTPDLTPVNGPSAASQDAAQPLGSYGDIERAATEN